MPLPLIAGPIAVVDVETTGLFPFRYDRIVEVAAVVVRADGEIEREFESLVNPGRDIGPSSIHGLTSEDVLHAPQFADIAGALLEALRGTVALAAHNVRFDLDFLASEFERLTYDLPHCFTICTMHMAGGGQLTDCCRAFGISTEGEAHRALTDARAAARLLTCLLPTQPRTVQELHSLPPIQWPNVSSQGRPPITREGSRRRQTEPPTFVQRLLGQVHHDAERFGADASLIAYGALLYRALEDRRVDDSEADALVETAVRWGLSGDQIELAHNSYLNQLAVAAVADGTVTDAERRELHLVARLLGQAGRDLDGLLAAAAAKVSETRSHAAQSPSDGPSLNGMRVCFTGELQCRYRGQAITREIAQALAADAGLFVVDSVTKKLDLLVLADPYSQSGKATKAREYGVRIIHESVFWKAIGVSVE